MPPDTATTDRRFTLEEVDPTRAAGSLSGAFQCFVADVLASSIPGLRCYPTEGKDGAIDLRARGEVQVICECKLIGTDGVAPASKQWRDVSERLRRNLADPGGPPIGQSQYGPWYDKEVPIQRYLFCISSRLQNAEQEDSLTKEIQAFFNGLAESAHLRHLAGLQVEVLDWGRLSSTELLKSHLRLRWFRRARPPGLMPLLSRNSLGGFREYLTGEHLPYYSRSDHAAVVPAPSHALAWDEMGLLDQLGSDDMHGMLISGAGGMGKTRLSLELAWRADEEGWVVLRAGPALKPEALETLARDLQPDDRVLVVFDYVETHSGFSEVVTELGDLNDTWHLHLRFLANCRTSYVSTLQIPHRYALVDLSPPSGDEHVWLDGYRKATVRQILSARGVDRLGDFAQLCHNIPVLAVFLCWLFDRGQEAQLQDLLDEGDFGEWVTSRVAMSFPGAFSRRDLAFLMALLPLRDPTFDALPQGRFAGLVDRLAADGWIEYRDADEYVTDGHWSAIHDVLADRVVVNYLLDEARATAPQFVRELLRLAGSCEGLDAALTSLQRIREQPPLTLIEWFDLIRREAEPRAVSWRQVRLLLLRSSLLTEQESVGLLDTLPDLWLDAEREPDFQMAAGWLCKWMTKTASEPVGDRLAGVLKEVVVRCAPMVGRSNFLLTHGLRLTSELRTDAYRWLWENPDEHQTHFLLVSWLESGQGATDVEALVQRWCQRFASSPNMSFLVRAWLDAGGTPGTVRKPIGEWLKEHRTVEAAQFVYCAWLDAKGDLALVEQPIGEWLKEHRTVEAAQFVYRAWLNAKGDLALVRQPIGEWLDKYGLTIDAGFVYRAWLDAKGDLALVKQPIGEWLDKYGLTIDAGFVYKGWLEAGGDFARVRDSCLAWLHVHCESTEAGYPLKFIAEQQDLPLDTVRDILTWCRIFCDSADAAWRLGRIGFFLGLAEIGEEGLDTCEVVLRRAMPRVQLADVILIGSITGVFWNLIRNPALRSGVARDRVDRLFLQWLRCPASFGSPQPAFAFVQKPPFFQRLADLVKDEQLDLVADGDAIGRYLDWVNNWGSEERSHLRKTARWLSIHYPAAGLWDRLLFDHSIDQ